MELLISCILPIRCSMMQAHRTVLARVANAFVAIAFAHAAAGGRTGASQRKN